MFEIGVMFWAGGDPAATLADLTAMGVHSGQLGVPEELPLNNPAVWKDALQAAAFRLHTVFAAFTGESYADIATVRRTVGFVPRHTRQQREERMLRVSDFAAQLGVASVAMHVGFIDEDHTAMRDLVRRVCDYAARHRQTLALETGQESAADLLSFIEDVARPNLAVNFDPANMILYGSGDPIAALETVAAHVVSVHAKDGDWPDAPGALGRERVLGEGSVGIERFMRKLRDIGFAGPIAVEREGSAGAVRLSEIRRGVELLRRFVV